MQSEPKPNFPPVRTQAEALEASADAREAAVEAAETAPRARLGASRKAVWGEATRAHQERGRAEALRKIAQPCGQALTESLAEARQRADYYATLTQRKDT